MLIYLAKRIVYKEAFDQILELCNGETNSVSLIATVVYETHNSDDRFDWTGFIGLQGQNYKRLVRIKVGMVVSEFHLTAASLHKLLRQESHL